MVRKTRFEEGGSTDTASARPSFEGRMKLRDAPISRKIVTPFNPAPSVRSNMELERTPVGREGLKKGGTVKKKGRHR